MGLSKIKVADYVPLLDLTHDAEKYQEAGSEPKTIRWYDAGHGLPEEAFVFQAAWLEKYIGIDASRYVW